MIKKDNGHSAAHDGGDQYREGDRPVGVAYEREIDQQPIEKCQSGQRRLRLG